MLRSLERKMCIYFSNKIFIKPVLETTNETNISLLSVTGGIGISSDAHALVDSPG